MLVKMEPHHCIYLCSDVTYNSNNQRRLELGVYDMDFLSPVPVKLLIISRFREKFMSRSLFESEGKKG